MTGHRGTRQARADCPVCDRDTAGGYANTARTRIILHRHNVPGTTRRCAGSQRTVDVQRNAMQVGGR